MFLYQFRTDKDLQFTGALAQNASAQADVLLPAGLQGVGGSAQNLVRAVSVISDQNLDWDIMFYGATVSGAGGADADVDYFLGKKSFVVADGKQIAAANSFYYYADGLNIPIVDRDAGGKIHIVLVNRNATGKNAGATGEIVVIVWLEPMQYGAGA